MAINSNSSDQITLEEAIAYTHNAQTAFPEQPKSFFVGINKLNLILEQQGCIGVRIYNGYSEKEHIKNLVLVGVDSEGEDMTNGVILERLVICPRFCPKNSPLMQR